MGSPLAEPLACYEPGTIYDDVNLNLYTCTIYLFIGQIGHEDPPFVENSPHLPQQLPLKDRITIYIERADKPA
jgi:hypothetical protein